MGKQKTLLKICCSDGSTSKNLEWGGEQRDGSQSLQDPTNSSKYQELINYLRKKQQQTSSETNTETSSEDEKPEDGKKTRLAQATNKRQRAKTEVICP